MPKNNEIKWKDYFDLPNQGLRSYFGNVVKGQPKVYDTPFAKGESTESLLNSWMEELSVVGDRWPSLWEFENDLASKVGPMSVMAPLQERIADIDHYYDDILLSSEPVSERAIKAVVAEWKGAGAVGLHLRNQRETVSKMKLSTNSGSPYFKKRRSVLSQTLLVNHLHINGDLVYQEIGDNHDEWYACAILGWRGQEGGYAKEDVKQRVIWMFPLAVNISELQVYQPLIEAAQKFDLVPAWTSMESVDKAITKLFDSKSKDDLVVCTDFSKFDQHFNPSLQYAAKSILQNIFTPGKNVSYWFDEIFGIKYMIPLAYNWEKIRYGKHGMASGSGGTNADETLAHRALQYEAAQRRNARLNPSSQCLGDDGILSFPGITVDDVIDSYTKHGLEMNKSKQYASKQDCVYLRRWHHEKYREQGICVGVYSSCRALGRLRYLERFMDPEVWGPTAVALRQLSILENVKYHPLKEQFVDFCMKRDKYRLGIDIPGFLDNIEQIAQETIDLMPDFLGYTKTLQSGGKVTGISTWWIVQYLKRKSS